MSVGCYFCRNENGNGILSEDCEVKWGILIFVFGIIL